MKSPRCGELRDGVRVGNKYSHLEIFVSTVCLRSTRNLQYLPVKAKPITLIRTVIASGRFHLHDTTPHRGQHTSEMIEADVDGVQQAYFPESLSRRRQGDNTQCLFLCTMAAVIDRGHERPPSLETAAAENCAFSFFKHSTGKYPGRSFPSQLNLCAKAVCGCIGARVSVVSVHQEKSEGNRVFFC